MTLLQTVYLLLWPITLLMELINAEVIYRNTELTTFNGTQNVECATFPCIINCNAISSCENTTISCPKSPATSGICVINLFNDYAGYQSTINTEASTHIYINANGKESLSQSTINAHHIQSKVEIGVIGLDALVSATIYAPYGNGSALTISCSTNGYNCAHMKIYDDYSTTVSLETYVDHGFYHTEVGKVYPNQYSSSLDTNYRGSVNLYSSTDHGFKDFVYYGTDHGHWNIESHGSHAFKGAIIYADHSFRTEESYTITVSGSTQPKSISNVTIYAAQNNAVISLSAISTSCFSPGFQLICGGDPSFVIDSLQMFAMDSHAFEGGLINVTNNIRNVTISTIATEIVGFADMMLSIVGTILNDILIHVLFSNSIIYIQRVDGNLAVIAAYGDGQVPVFGGSNFSIGTINGTATFVARSDEAFSGSYISIDYCKYVTFESNTTNAFSFSNILFGENVEIVNVSINGGNTALVSSVWDCRTCDEFILNCNNEADCSGRNQSGETVNIYCPKNNQKDKCQLQCSEGAVCDFMDIYTSNGYCVDVKIVCDSEISNNCSFRSTKVYCTINTLHNYGIKTNSYCEMVQNTSDNYIWPWRCEKYAFDDSYCVHVCAEEPTFDPTINPIVSTYYPTQASKETQTGSTRTLGYFGVHVWIIGALVGTGLLGLLLCLGCKCYKKKHGDQVVPSKVPVSPNRMASHSVSRDKDDDDDEQMGFSNFARNNYSPFLSRQYEY